MSNKYEIDYNKTINNLIALTDLIEEKYYNTLSQEKIEQNILSYFYDDNFLDKILTSSTSSIERTYFISKEITNEIINKYIDNDSQNSLKLFLDD